MLSSHHLSVALSSVFSQGSRSIRSLSVRGLSGSSVLGSDPIKPRKNGDKGPERNYRRKMNKKMNKTQKGVPVDAESILGSLKQEGTSEGGVIDFIDWRVS